MANEYQLLVENPLHENPMARKRTFVFYTQSTAIMARNACCVAAGYSTDAYPTNRMIRGRSSVSEHSEIDPAHPDKNPVLRLRLTITRVN